MPASVAPSLRKRTGIERSRRSDTRRPAMRGAARIEERPTTCRGWGCKSRAERERPPGGVQGVHASGREIDESGRAVGVVHDGERAAVQANRACGGRRERQCEDEDEESAGHSALTQQFSALTQHLQHCGGARRQALPRSARREPLRRPDPRAPARVDRDPALPARAPHAYPARAAGHAHRDLGRVRRPADDAARQHPAARRRRARAADPAPDRRSFVPSRADRSRRADDARRGSAARRVLRGGRAPAPEAVGRLPGSRPRAERRAGASARGAGGARRGIGAAVRGSLTRPTAFPARGLARLALRRALHHIEPRVTSERCRRSSRAPARSRPRRARVRGRAGCRAGR